MNVVAQSNVKSLKLHARITRANGEVVDLGEIAVWHRNPVIRFFLQLRLRLRMKLAGV